MRAIGIVAIFPGKHAYFLAGEYHHPTRVAITPSQVPAITPKFQISQKGTLCPGPGASLSSGNRHRLRVRIIFQKNFKSM
jgi:hypothetical protein